MAGAVIAAQRGPRLAAAVVLVGVALAWDQLFLVYDVLPATIPPALVLLGTEVAGRRYGPRA